MEIKKGTKIRETKTNPDPLLADTTENRTLVYEVVRVNRKTYSLKCIEGYMKNTGCNLTKTALEHGPRTNIYGTTTVLEVIA